MQLLNHDEQTDLYRVEDCVRWYERPADALWFAFLSKELVRSLTPKLISIASMHFVMHGRTNLAKLSEDITSLLRPRFAEYLSFVCLADEEEVEETVEMIDFKLQSRLLALTVLAELH